MPHHLNLRYQLLLSACGIGPTSAVQILAQLAVLSPDLDVRQWVARAGIDPRQYTSGSSVQKRTRISKTGNRDLRAFYQYLLARGKTRMQALVAVMGKLLHAISGVFKHQHPFDGTKLYRLPAESALPQPAFSTTEVACPT
jgi:transposase